LPADDRGERRSLSKELLSVALSLLEQVKNSLPFI